MTRSILTLILILFTIVFAKAQTAMTNVDARNSTCLNGKWQTIIDPTGVGNWREVWKEKVPEKKTDFYEYSFEGGPVLEVPGDFNSQIKEITYLEGTVWYKKTFTYTRDSSKRLFIHFGAVNYLADIYLNGEHLGQHEGGFTPFQFELTHKVLEGENRLIVKADNSRKSDGLPGLGFDWFNYGGITRDVNLVETNATYIDDYSIQLKKGSNNQVLGWVKLNGKKPQQQIEINIPELNVKYKTQSNAKGIGVITFKGKFDHWSPENPKRYEVIIKCETDALKDTIGFRTIKVQGPTVVLNGKSIFLKSINIHEENPLKGARAFSKDDAKLLLTWAKELGCNMVRLAHYPHNEYMVKMAEKMGLMVWSEIPVYQHIEFSTPGVEDKMDLMMREMIKRDKNRCGVVIWSLSNETYSSTANRDLALSNLTKKCRALDSTRLITHVINTQGYANNTFNVWDTLYRYSDIISINEYVGWYEPWQGKPVDTKWDLIYPDKPVFISEFGGEALYGSNYGPKDEAAYWSEEYQEQIYKDQIEMFKTVPNLVGVCPWLLVDYRSLGRMHPIYQKGYNRKGLLSEKGEKKKAWFVMKNYYDKVSSDE
ncbi:MAG: glycoside hydrolase family 2 [Salinivirgaceae bacterium]|jgi:beta-glucuronidase|nr:glycoside hydrolase family 2 [Salinivirgaceae bacterium]